MCDIHVLWLHTETDRVDFSVSVVIADSCFELNGHVDLPWKERPPRGGVWT